METIVNIKGLSPAAQEEVFAVLQRAETYEESGNAGKANKAKEELADLLKQYGLHEESRQYYSDLEKHSTKLIDKARLLRKISSSYFAQRQLFQAHRVAEEALWMFRKVDKRELDMTEFFEALIACSFANYFLVNKARHEELIKEMKSYFPVVTDQSVKLRFYHAILHDIFLRYRWHMFPEESITHAEFYLQMARETENNSTIATAYSILGFIHLWREEFELCRKNFEKGFELLQDRNLELWNQIYTTVSYRMQNNIALTEKWALTSIETANKTQNELYLGVSYGNLAWVHAKRNNWLYAEEYAKKGLAILTSFRFPMAYLCLFPLLECLYKNGKYEEAGTYCYLLVHPTIKRFPDTINKKLEQMNFAWSVNDKEEIKARLKEVITEAKLTNYF